MAINYGSLPFAEALAFLRAKLNLPTQHLSLIHISEPTRPY